MQSFLIRFLVAMVLLVLLFFTAFETKSAINNAVLQALMEQADTFISNFQAGDYQAMNGIMTTESQQALDDVFSVRYVLSKTYLGCTRLAFNPKHVFLVHVAITI